jgi:hypothetical protein
MARYQCGMDEHESKELEASADKDWAYRSCYLLNSVRYVAKIVLALTFPEPITGVSTLYRLKNIHMPA